MKTIQVDALTGQHNYAVVRLPERRFPGVVVQGDSLATLVESLRRGVDLVHGGQREEGLGEVAEVLDVLESALRGYEEALDAHSIARPY